MTKTDSGVEVGKLSERVEVLELVKTPRHPSGDTPLFKGGAIPTRLRREPLSKGAFDTEDAGSGPPAWVWEPVRRTWARVELSGKRNIFSKTGFGARDAVLTLRRQELTLHNALEVGGAHILPTSITRLGRNFLEVHGAVCRISRLTARPQAGTGRDALNRPVAEERPAFSFPGVLTELYAGQEREEIAYTGEHRLTLVAPKAVALRAGDLVEQAGAPVWVVRRVLDLEEYYNEYVLERQADV